MGSYSPTAYGKQAAKLPQGLSSAIQQNLGETPAQYLSDAAAAADGSQVVKSLSSRGVPVLGSHMDGTTLVVNVATATGAAAVQSAGAVAVVGAPAPSPYAGLKLLAADTLAGGEGWGYVNGATGIACSVGFNGRAVPSGSNEFVTAGHCIQSGTQPASVQSIVQTSPGLTSVDFGPTIGAPVAGSFEFGNDFDSGLIQVTGSGFTPQPEITTWGGGQGSPASDQVAVTGETPAIAGAPVCKSGATSGWTCGTVLAVDQVEQIGEDDSNQVTPVNAIVTNACVLPGDSGGPALSGTLAIGTTTASDWSGNCDPQPDAVSVFFPMESAAGHASVASHYGSTWELSVSVPTPAVSSPADGTAVFTGSAMTGTVPGGSAGEIVHLYLNGSATPLNGAVGSGGSWSIPLTGAVTGQNSYSIKATFGTDSTSATTIGTFTLVPRPSVTRTSGADRYWTAVAVAQSEYSGTVKTVYLATGSDFADALSAAPAAAAAHAPVLLTAPGSLPPEVEGELTRLAPKDVFVVGGASAVSSSVLTEVASLSSHPTVTRLAGADRYATSRAVASAEFHGTAQAVFIATGLDFPDALSAGAAAGAHHDPVILVPGTETKLDAPTTSTLKSLDPGTIYVVGGPSAVSAGLATTLGTIAHVDRLSGSDRYGTSVAVGQAMFPSASKVFLASGANFPDALVGAAEAGSGDEPLYLAQPTCVPDGVVSEIGRLGASNVSLLGGTSALGATVEALSIC